MADLIDELEKEWQARPGQNLEAELEQTWQAQPKPQGYNLLGAGRWLANNPGAVARAVVQTAGAAGGAALGAAGGPAAAVAGGGAGSLAGDVIGRLMTGQEMPSLTEGAVDFVAGGAGPLAAAAPRGVARSMIGANVAERRAAETAVGRTLMDDMANLGAQGRTRSTVTEAELDQAMTHAMGTARESLRESLRGGSTWAGRVFDVATLGPGAYTLITGNLPTAVAALIAGGTATHLRREMAERLLNNDSFIRFVMRPEMGKVQNAVGILGAAVGPLGQRYLGADERDMARILLGGPEPESTLGGRPPERRAEAQKNPFDGVVLTATGGQVGRDRASGQFISLE